MPPPVPERARAQEGRDRVVAAVPGRQRRHRPRRVLGQQREHRVHVGVLQRARVALDELALALLAERLERLRLRARRQPLLDDRARPLQRGVHRRRASCPSRRRSPARRTRARRTSAAPRAGWAAGAGPRRRTPAPRSRRARPCSSGRSANGSSHGTSWSRTLVTAWPVSDAGGDLHGQHPPLLAVELVQARVRRDPVQPRAQRRAALEALAPAPGAQAHFLQHVLGVVRGAEHPVAVGAQLGAELTQWIVLAHPRTVRGADVRTFDVERVKTRRPPRANGRRMHCRTRCRSTVLMRLSDQDQVPGHRRPPRYALMAVVGYVRHE